MSDMTEMEEVDSRREFKEEKETDYLLHTDRINTNVSNGDARLLITVSEIDLGEIIISKESQKLSREYRNMLRFFWPVEENSVRTPASKAKLERAVAILGYKLKTCLFQICAKLALPIV